MALVAKQQHAAAEQRDLEPEHGRQRHDRPRRCSPMQAVRQQLAHDQLPACDRRHVQLLERAQLLLADDRHRRQVRRDHQQQQRDDAGNHEVAALELRVEPDADARLDRLRRHAPAGRDCLPLDELLVVGGDEVGGIAQRDVGGIRVGAVGDDLHDRGTPVARACPDSLPGIASASHARPRSSHGSISLRLSTVPTTVKYGEASKRVDQLAASRGSVLIDDDHRHVAHVGGRGVAEHRQLDDRRDEDHGEQPRILPELQQFLPHDVPEAPHVRPTPSLRRIAARPVTMAAKRASAPASRQRPRTRCPSAARRGARPGSTAPARCA